jgi:16S rRNA (adenine1518-N6/adenine1519-N6)-dimethyltransferase
VVEIGAGLGVLTRELAQRAEKVTALEFDQNIFPALRKNLIGRENIELLNLDVRKFVPPVGKYKLVANIPYYLTSPILRQFYVETSNRPELTVLLIQKEVAEKICLRDKLSVLALQVQIFGEPQIISKVAPGSFLPPPKVESAILKIVLKPELAVPEADLPDFFKLVHAGFRAPRKKIRGSLAAAWPIPKEQIDKILLATEINQDKRPEDLTVQEWLKILVVFREQQKQ